MAMAAYEVAKLVSKRTSSSSLDSVSKDDPSVELTGLMAAGESEPALNDEGKKQASFGENFE